MKPAVVFVIAFVAATAASTGAKVMITPPPKPAVDSTHADSSKSDSTKAAGDSSAKSVTDTAVVASGAPVTPPSDTLHKAAPDSAPKTSLEQKLAAAAAAAQVPDTAEEHRVAKVFTSMDAKQAAKVLEHMSDNDVKVILGYVGVKQAATIMAALPPERVAKLTAFTPAGAGKSK